MRVLCCVVCVVHGRQLASQEQSNKRSRQALKERLRALLTTFKTAMLPRADGEAKLLGWVGVCVCVCLVGENAARNPVHHPVLRRSGRRWICSYGCIHARVVAVLFCRFACVAALPDVHEGSPTPAMQGVTTLVACLGTNDYSRMAPASLEAAAAPLHAVDVLLQCCDELTEGLNSAHREVCFVCVCVCACACVRVCVRVRVCVADSTRRCCFAPSM